MYRRLSIVMFSIWLAACTGTPSRDERTVVAKLDRYRMALLQGKADQAADLFDASAEVSHENSPPVLSQASIRKFLASFVDYKVLEYQLDATSTAISGNAASQRGSYRQKVRTPSGETVEVRGVFEADWIREPKHGWLLHRMHTASAPQAR